MDYFVFSDIHGQKELFDKILNWLRYFVKEVAL